MSERRLISLHTNNLKSNTVQSLKASAPVKTGKWELPAWEVEDGWEEGSEQNGAGTLTPANNSELLHLLEV